MRILSLAGEFSLLGSVFILLGFEFQLVPSGVPFAFILFCFLVVSFLIGAVGICVGCLGSFSSGLRRAEFLALMASCVIPVLLVHFIVGAQNFSLSETNDVTTNIENPPEFNRSRDSRHAATNFSQIWNFLKIPERVTKHPSLRTIEVDLSCESLVPMVFTTFHYLGWPMSFVDRTANSIEAKASWSSANQINDFVVRMTPLESKGCGVALRSASRHERRDLGMNLLLLDRFMAKFSMEFRKQHARPCVGITASNHLTKPMAK
jgi:hypothetical protein|tara:strand:+ start:174 stop:962 length:789 start_codon:yes stop_codon:yes gene_type:complete